jgi:hypothetical protein
MTDIAERLREVRDLLEEVATVEYTEWHDERIERALAAMPNPDAVGRCVQFTKERLPLLRPSEYPVKEYVATAAALAKLEGS